MSQSHQPLNETANQVNLPRYKHPINHRFDFTPDMGMLYPVRVEEMYPNKRISYNVQNVVQLMPLAGDCKQDMYMYTESVFSSWDSLWKKWSLFRYGRLNPSSGVAVPETVPYFTLQDIFDLESNMAGSDVKSVLLKPGGLLDTLYGLVNLIKPSINGVLGDVTIAELESSLSADTRNAPINGLYLRAYYHNYLVYHTNEWLNASRYNMVNDEYPYRDNDTMTMGELQAILLNEIYGSGGGDMTRIQHERDYFTSANPQPQKGAAEMITSNLTVQGLTKIIHQQEIKEKDADAGTSHAEAISSRYGIYPKSLGHQKPIQVGRTTRQVISINPIFNQAGDTVAPSSSGLNGVNFQGDVSGRGFSADGNHHVEFLSDVDGCIMTCIFIRPETIYHQGLNNKFCRVVRNDFFEPAMIKDGDEPIYNRELVHPLMSNLAKTQLSQVHPNSVFGYRNKYLDFIYNPSRVSGEFHTTMKSWSLHRDFVGQANLNDTFVRAFDTPRHIFSYEGQPSRAGYPRFVCYMQFNGMIDDLIPTYTKREI